MIMFSVLTFGHYSTMSCAKKSSHSWDWGDVSQSCCCQHLDRQAFRTNYRKAYSRKASEGYFDRGPKKDVKPKAMETTIDTHTLWAIQYHHVIHGMQFDIIWLCLELPSFESHGGMANRFPLATPICSRPGDASRKQRPKGDPRNKKLCINHQQPPNHFWNMLKPLRWLTLVDIG